MRVLSLCTGNYFRSRFSQALFQQLIEINQATGADLDAADVVVAVDEAAHRPMVQLQFPAWDGRIRFWTVKDPGEEDGVDPIAQIKHLVQQLFDELKPG